MNPKMLHYGAQGTLSISINGHGTSQTNQTGTRALPHLASERITIKRLSFGLQMVSVCPPSPPHIYPAFSKDVSAVTGIPNIHFLQTRAAQQHQIKALGRQVGAFQAAL